MLKKIFLNHKEIQRVSEICRTITEDLTFLSSESQKESEAEKYFKK